jgi:hypothetical protein
MGYALHRLRCSDSSLDAILRDVEAVVRLRTHLQPSVRYVPRMEANSLHPSGCGAKRAIKLLIEHDVEFSLSSDQLQMLRSLLIHSEESLSPLSRKRKQKRPKNTGS